MLDPNSSDFEDQLGNLVDEIYLSALDSFNTVQTDFNEDEYNRISSFFEQEEYSYMLYDLDQSLEEWEELPEVASALASADREQIFDFRFSDPKDQSLFIFGVLIVDQDLFIRWLIPNYNE